MGSAGLAPARYGSLRNNPTDNDSGEDGYRQQTEETLAEKRVFHDSPS